MVNPHQNITAKQFILKLVKDELKGKEWIVKDELIIDSTVKFDKLHLKNITFQEKVKIGYSTIQFGLFFENCEFIKPVSIDRLVCDAYSHNENIENCNVLFSSCKVSYIHISNQSEFLRDIIFKNKCEIENLLITETKISSGGGIKLNDSSINN